MEFSPMSSAPSSLKERQDTTIANKAKDKLLSTSGINPKYILPDPFLKLRQVKTHLYC